MKTELDAQPTPMLAILQATARMLKIRNKGDDEYTAAILQQAADAIAAKEAELADVRHDIARHIQIAANLTNELAATRCPLPGNNEPAFCSAQSCYRCTVARCTRLEVELAAANAKHRDEMTRLDKAWATTAEETASRLETERTARKQALATMYEEREARKQAEQRLAAVEAAIATAYGYLWHVNNATHIPLFLPEQAAYEARKVLRDLMTSEQRGEAINRVKTVLAAAKEGKA